MKKQETLKFEDIIAPIKVEAFFKDYWSNNFLHLKGSKNRFNHLLPWKELNKILSEHRFDSHRVRLSKKGKAVAAEEYINMLPPPSGKGSPIPALSPEKINEKLNEGASLALNSVDELYEPVKQLTQKLEYLFNENITVNAYLSFGSDNAFDIHVDIYDVFIIQVFGKKNWSIYGQTQTRYPLMDTALAKPPTKAVWQKTLNEGDMLYMPRGWWHNAAACNEPSLHLTVGIRNRKGIDFYNWLAKELSREEIFRMDIPYLKDDDTLNKYLEELKTKLNRAFNRATFDKYINDNNANARIRQRFSFPNSVHNSALANDVKLGLATGRKIKVSVDKKTETFSFITGGAEWSFSILCKPFFDMIITKKEWTIAEAKKCFKKISADDFSAFIKEVLATGLVYIRE